MQALCFVNVQSISFAGVKNGACMYLQDLLDRPLLWTACRHHVGEIMISSVWKSSIEVSQGPEIMMFKKCIANYKTVTQDITNVSFNANSVTNPELILKKPPSLFYSIYHWDERRL